ncbi:MAG TPA: S8 family serine peptidase, partial [Chloroflexia bacterium]|nr:S8 family serine peptidase [Chloroflexia bacterium]
MRIKGSTIRQGVKAVRALVVASMLLGMLTPLVQVTPAAAAPLPAPAAGQPDSTLILVKFKASAPSASVDSDITAKGGQNVRTLSQIRTRVVRVPSGAKNQVLAAFSGDALVERSAPVVSLRMAGIPDDPGYAQQWALPKVAWDEAYDNVPIAGNAKIAVLDTGVDATHPDLAGRVVGGQSFISGNANTDPNGHGTALAGIAAANVNNHTGMAGVAYAGASVSSVQVLGTDGTGSDADVVAGVLWAADSGADVILMGFSSTAYSAALADAVAYAWSHGVVLVAATGNDGTATTTYPAGLPNVIGVASTDSTDHLAASSNTGSAAVAAPGVGIYATQPGGGYGSTSGTSAASAEVAGLAALLVADGRSNSQASTQIRGATDAVAGQAFGRINVAAALGAPAPPPATATPVAQTPTPGATATYVASALGVTATYNATATTINATASGQSNGNKQWQYGYTPPGGSTPTHWSVCKDLDTNTPLIPDAGTDAYQLPVGSVAGTWKVALYEYNNSNTCRDDGSGRGNKEADATFDVSVSTGPISGIALNDLNGNGLDNSDPPLSAATIKLFQDSNGNGVLDTPGDVVLNAGFVTQATGTWSFTGLGSGTYFVTETDPVGFVSTGASPGTGTNTTATIVNSGQIK